MKLKGFILSLVFLTLIPISASSIDQTIKNWGDLDDRSFSSEPTLSQDESNIYVTSDKELENLRIEITDLSNNTVIYSTVTTVFAGEAYPTDITSLQSGNYLFKITQGSNYIIGVFAK